MRSSHGLTCGSVARRPREAARPAAQHEGVGVDDAEAVAEQPRPAVARELGVDLVEHRADLRLGVRLDGGGAGGVVGPALGVEVEDRARPAACSRTRPATCRRAPARACRARGSRAAPGWRVGQVQADRRGLVEDERRAVAAARRSSTRTGISPFGLSARYSADLCAAWRAVDVASARTARRSPRARCAAIRLALPGK